MAKLRQIILFASDSPTGAGAPKMKPLGQKREVLKTLARFNTAQDGSKAGESFAYGPGMVVQFPMTGSKDDELNQVLVAVNEEEIAWAVLQNICKQTGWRMMDPDTGRVFGGQG